MAIDFFSAEYGWLRSPDGTQTTQILFRPGKGRDGYFDNEHIRAHAKQAMDILKQHYPNEHHIFIFDNAWTHAKRAETSISALWMPKNPSKKFLIDVNDLGSDGNVQYETDGRIKKKKKICMANGRFSNGTEQAFYFPEGHNQAGWFKGMAVILEKRGYSNVKNLRASCGSSLKKCPNQSNPEEHCCCRRLMFYQPDFMEINSILETDVKSQGFHILFLLKFYCELNPIEQCWGYAKRLYRLREPSSNEAVLRKNVDQCLDQVPLITMRWQVSSFVKIQLCTHSK